MIGPMPLNANEFIEHQLDQRASALQELLNGDVLAFSGPIVGGVDDVFRDVVEAKRQQQPIDQRSDRLIVVLTTPGGYIEVVQRIVDTLRHHYEYVDFIIPNYAFSAGTVLVMSGDAIYMDYYSRLGPIDPQVETSSGRMVPALGYLIQYERLVEKARQGKISLAEAQLLIDGFDQAELYQYEQARELSITLLKEWLVRYKFKNWTTTQTRHRQVTRAMKTRRAASIARELNKTEKWHVHGHGISMDILTRDLNLLIDDFGADPQLCAAVKQYHTLLDDYMMKRGNRGVVHTVGKYLPLSIA